MIPRELAPRLAAPGTGAAPEWHELEHSLRGWKAYCDEASAALRGQDLDALEAALTGREALRLRIAELVLRLRPVDREGEHQERLVELERAASAADARLVAQLRADLDRLKSELDGLGRATAPAVAYALPAEPRHRLDIRR